MTKPLVEKELGSSKDHGQLRGGNMFNWTIVPMGIANSTGVVGAESIMMSPVMTETALVSKTSGGGVTWSG